MVRKQFKDIYKVLDFLFMKSYSAFPTKKKKKNTSPPWLQGSKQNITSVFRGSGNSPFATCTSQSCFKGGKNASLVWKLPAKLLDCTPSQDSLQGHSEIRHRNNSGYKEAEEACFLCTIFLNQQNYISPFLLLQHQSPLPVPRAPEETSFEKLANLFPILELLHDAPAYFWILLT